MAFPFTPNEAHATMAQTSSQMYGSLDLVCPVETKNRSRTTIIMEPTTTQTRLTIDDLIENATYFAISQPLTNLGDYAKASLIGIGLTSHTIPPDVFHTLSRLPRQFVNQQSSPVLLLICAVGLLWLYRSISAYYRASKRSRRFQKFSYSQGCSPTSALPQRFLGGVRHKLSLLTYTGGDLLDGLFASKYQIYGPTHALHDKFHTPVVIHTIDPQNVNAVFNSSWNDWKPGKSRTNTLKPLAQGGLLLADGEQWHRKRKLIQRHMGVSRAKDAGRDAEHIDQLFQAIGPAGEDGWTEVVDLLDMFQRLALDMSTSFLLGMSANSQAAGIAEAAARKSGIAKRKSGLETSTSTGSGAPEMSYNEAYEIIRDHLSWRSKLGSLYWLADGPKYRRACRTLDRYCDDLVSQGMARAAAARDDPSRLPDGKICLIDKLIADVADPAEIRDMVMDLFIAGQNMTGTMAAWIFAQLEQHPDYFHRVRDEVLSRFGTEDEPKAPLTWANLAACTTMQHIILETMRMYPLLANITRNARCDTVLPYGGGPDGTQPIAVPKGTTVTCNLYLMHRRAEEWGPDAWAFRPDRWIGRKFGPEYAPFGSGARICPGQQLSMTELSLLMARMLQRFDELRAPEDQDNLVKGYRAILAPKHGLKVRLRRAGRVEEKTSSV